MYNIYMYNYTSYMYVLHVYCTCVINTLIALYRWREMA